MEAPPTSNNKVVERNVNSSTTNLALIVRKEAAKEAADPSSPLARAAIIPSSPSAAAKTSASAAKALAEI